MLVFFFSSRRRHTRWPRDWSSDVCSSDLGGTAMKELRTEIEFDGTPQEVWGVLADLPAHGEWNPFITRIEGELRPGAKLDVRLEPEGERGITMHPTVLAAEPGRQLRWLGHLLVRGIFDGEHRWLIEEAGPGRGHGDPSALPQQTRRVEGGARGAAHGRGLPGDRDRASWGGRGAPRWGIEEEGAHRARSGLSALGARPSAPVPAGDRRAAAEGAVARGPRVLGRRVGGHRGRRRYGSCPGGLGARPWDDDPRAGRALPPERRPRRSVGRWARPRRTLIHR